MDTALLRQVVLKVTEAEAVLCDDVVACARRQREQRHERKWGRAA
jgi:hypothetical protein